MPTTIPYRPRGVAGERAHREADPVGAIWDPVVLVAIAMILCLLAAQFDPDTLWPIPSLIGP